MGSNTGWPRTPDDFTEALNALSREGDHLVTALGASMWLPHSITFGTYLEVPEDAEVDGLSFAEIVIQLATRFAEQAPLIIADNQTFSLAAGFSIISKHGGGVSFDSRWHSRSGWSMPGRLLI